MEDSMLKVPLKKIDLYEIYYGTKFDSDSVKKIIKSESHNQLDVYEFMQWNCFFSFTDRHNCVWTSWAPSNFEKIRRTIAIRIKGEPTRAWCAHCNAIFLGGIEGYELCTPDQEMRKLIRTNKVLPSEETERKIQEIRAHQEKNGLPQITRILDQYNEQNQLINKYIKDKIHVKHCCPICEKQLVRYEVGYGFLSCMPEIENQINMSEITLAKEVCNATLAALDIPVKCGHSSDNIQAVKNDPERMKEYISTLMDLEVNIYSTSKRLEQLYLNRISNDRQITGEQSLMSFQEARKQQAQIDRAEQNLKDAQDFLAKHESNVPSPVQVDYPDKPLEPTYATPFFFNRKKVEARNQGLREAYEKALEEYKIETEKCRKEEKRLKTEAKEEHQKLVQTARENVSLARTKLEKARSDYQNERKKIAEKMSTIRIPSTVLRDILAKDIEEAETYLKKAIECRNQLYSCNIIFPKYRDAVPLSMFYEYFSSGRCTTLEGPNGAYNIYEMETRSNLIISQLNTVIESLETIKQNQYMIYSKLSSINSKLETMGKTFDTMASTLNSMDGKLDNIEKNSAVIAHNSAVSAYYSKVNAELTNALGYMIALK